VRRTSKRANTVFNTCCETLVKAGVGVNEKKGEKNKEQRHTPLYVVENVVLSASSPKKTTVTSNALIV
jgi:hypothetical protein